MTNEERDLIDRVARARDRAVDQIESVYNTKDQLDRIERKLDWLHEEAMMDMDDDYMAHRPWPGDLEQR